MTNDRTDRGSDPETVRGVESGTTSDTDQWVQVDQARYDRDSDGELVTALIYAIADAKGVDPLDSTELPPLYESVDAHSLEETFFGPQRADTQRNGSGTISFSYNRYKVALRSDGWIFVYEPT